MAHHRRSVSSRYTTESEPKGITHVCSVWRSDFYLGSGCVRIKMICGSLAWLPFQRESARLVGPGTVQPVSKDQHTRPFPTKTDSHLHVTPCQSALAVGWLSPDAVSPQDFTGLASSPLAVQTLGPGGPGPPFSRTTEDGPRI